MDIFTVFGLLGSIFYSLMLVPMMIQAHVYGQSDAHMGHLLLQLIANICFTIYSIGVFKNAGLSNTLPMFIANPLSVISIIYLMRVRWCNLRYPKVDPIRVGCSNVNNSVI